VAQASRRCGEIAAPEVLGVETRQGREPAPGSPSFLEERKAGARRGKVIQKRELEKNCFLAFHFEKMNRRFKSSLFPEHRPIVTVRFLP
jgi:hypothetical protein